MKEHDNKANKQNSKTRANHKQTEPQSEMCLGILIEYWKNLRGNGEKSRNLSTSLNFNHNILACQSRSMVVYQSLCKQIENLGNELSFF